MILLNVLLILPHVSHLPLISCIRSLVMKIRPMVLNLIILRLLLSMRVIQMKSCAWMLILTWSLVWIYTIFNPLCSWPKVSLLLRLEFPRIIILFYISILTVFLSVSSAILSIASRTRLEPFVSWIRRIAILFCRFSNILLGLSFFTNLLCSLHLEFLFVCPVMGIL